MTNSRFETVHAQLTTLLENAQYLLSDYYGLGSGKTGLSTTATTIRQLPVYSLLAMQAEIRTLEFWRSIIAECTATFFYVIIVLATGTAASEHTLQTHVALAAGLSISMLTSCFGRISGCHVNPAITLGVTLIKHLSPLRAILYVCAQCGGGIAGAALVMGVMGRINDVALENKGGTFGMEFILTFLISYTFCISREKHISPYTTTSTNTSHNTSTTNTTSNFNSVTAIRLSTPSVHHKNPLLMHRNTDNYMVGIAYAACLICWRGSLNPARALGSSFVIKTPGRFKYHWIFWVGPILGAVTGALSYEYIFNTKRKSSPFGTMKTNELDQFTIEEEMMDDLERARQYKTNIMQDFQDPYASQFNRNTNTYKRMGPTGNLMSNQEPIYGGTRSMYNQPLYDSYNTTGRYESKSMYGGGYDDRSNMLRRTRSIHSKLPAVGGSMNPRRNPYDYLPDEPVTNTGVGPNAVISSVSGPGMGQNGTKPDIMQSTIVNESGNSRLLGTGSKPPLSSSPRYNDTYVGDKLGDTYDTAYGTTSRVKDDYPDTTYSSLKNRSYPGGDTATGASVAGSNLNRAEFPRMSRMRGVGGGGGSGPSGSGGDFYSPQYNSASYSQQNGCSIATNSAATGGAYGTSRNNPGVNY